MVAGKYQKLATEIEREIKTGMYARGFPSASELAKTKGVSLNTAKASLTILEGKGLLEKRGPQFYLTEKALTMTGYMEPPHARFKQGFSTNIGPVLRGSLPEHIREKFELTQTACVDRRFVAGERTEQHAERPLMLTQRYYLLPLEDLIVDRMNIDGTYDPMWDRSIVSEEMLRSSDIVSARSCTKEEEVVLHLEKRTAVLFVLEAISDMEGNLLMVQEVTLSPSSSLTFAYAFKNRPQ